MIKTLDHFNYENHLFNYLPNEGTNINLKDEVIVVHRKHGRTFIKIVSDLIHKNKFNTVLGFGEEKCETYLLIHYDKVINSDNMVNYVDYIEFLYKGYLFTKHVNDMDMKYFCKYSKFKSWLKKEQSL